MQTREAPHRANVPPVECMQVPHFQPFRTFESYPINRQVHLFAFFMTT
jgi:hypothetical protein